MNRNARGERAAKKLSKGPHYQKGIHGDGQSPPRSWGMMNEPRDIREGLASIA